MGGLLATFSLWGSFLVRFSTYGGPFSPCEGLSAPFSPWGRGAFCYVFLLIGGPFHYVRAFLLLFSMWGGGLFCSHGGLFFGRAPMHITYIIILSCENVSQYKSINNIDNPNTYILCTYCCKYKLKMSLHQAYILQNNELTM